MIPIQTALLLSTYVKCKYYTLHNIYLINRYNPHLIFIVVRYNTLMQYNIVSNLVFYYLCACRQINLFVIY